MPKADQHLHQYKKNREILKDPNFNINVTNNSDWVITIIFYSALHLIEKFFDEKKIECSSHQYRFQQIYKIQDTKRIAGQYKTLYDQSIRARYNCTTFTEKDLTEAISLLDQIEKHFKI